MSEHHKETFITKYIFSLDHKMIAKQFLITGMFMGVVGMTMSILFRLQLSNPGESFPVLEFFLGEKWAPGGVLDPNMYLALVTMHGTILVFWVLTAGLTGTFANFLIPLPLSIPFSLINPIIKLTSLTQLPFEFPNYDLLIGFSPNA